MRKTPLTPMLMSNLECFDLDQIIRIMRTEPEGCIIRHAKSRLGALLDMETEPFEIFNERNKP